MADSLPPIYFYLPKAYFPHDLPLSAGENWPGFGLGIYAWTLQTYLHLQADGFPCQLVSSFPAEGIILFHRNALRAQAKPLQPNSRRLLICIKAEERRYPYAQLHIVQNPQETNFYRDSYYLPHWPQPGLIPRCQRRGDRFQNIAYFGHLANLAPQLQDSAWSKHLGDLGLRWLPVINTNPWHKYSQIDNRWNNYSQIDAIVAVRNFASSETYLNKPATKLYNAWLAGVPALLGAESAYRAEGKNGVNYLEVTSPPELIAALKQLQSDLALRHRLVKAGIAQAQHFQPEKVRQKWSQFLGEIAIPAFYRWCETPSYSQLAILERNKWEFRLERARAKLKALLLNPR